MNSYFIDVINCKIGAFPTKNIAYGMLVDVALRYKQQIPSFNEIIRLGYSHSVKHIPSDEEWYVIGINPTKKQVCAAGYPASIANISDCIFSEEIKPLTEEEKSYRNRVFGNGWL